MGVDRIVLYTEAYADHYGKPTQKEITAKYLQCAQLADSMGLEINAGHDLNLHNLKHFVQTLPMVKEVSIGHALVCDALEMGWQQTVIEYLRCLY